MLQCWCDPLSQTAQNRQCIICFSSLLSRDMFGVTFHTYNWVFILFFSCSNAVRMLQPEHDAATTIFHHRDGISLTMSITWCLPHIVLIGGILPEDLFCVIRPQNIFPCPLITVWQTPDRLWLLSNYSTIRAWLSVSKRVLPSSQIPAKDF